MTGVKSANIEVKSIPTSGPKKYKVSGAVNRQGPGEKKELEQKKKFSVTNLAELIGGEGTPFLALFAPWIIDW